MSIQLNLLFKEDVLDVTELDIVHLSATCKSSTNPVKSSSFKRGTNDQKKSKSSNFSNKFKHSNQNEKVSHNKSLKLNQLPHIKSKKRQKIKGTGG